MKSEKETSIKFRIKQLLFILFIAILGYFSYYYIDKGLNNSKELIVSYDSDSDINYKVYLLDNNFFTEPYLGENKTYIASLIDYLDVVFKYNLFYDKNLSGEYKYYVRATISADKNGSSNVSYWSKSYILSKPEVIKFNDQDNFSVISKVKVDYQKYSKLLKDFRKEYGLSIDGFLNLDLVVESNGMANNMSKNVKVNSVVSLSIPLTEQAIELTIDSSKENNSGVVVEKIVLEGVQYKIFLVLGIVLGIIDLLLLAVFIHNILEVSKSKSKYDKELEKILSTYDSIIVNTTNIPNFDNYKSIYVNSFHELIDAHSEVRLPINYVQIEPGYESMFVLISGEIAWIYLLKDEKRKKSKKKKI